MGAICTLGVTQRQHWNLRSALGSQSTAATWVPSAPLVSRNDSIGTYGQPSDLLKAKQRLRKLELGYSQALSIHQESSPRTLSWDLEAHTAEALHIEEEQMPMTTKGRVRRNESPLPLRRAPSLRKSLSTDVDHAAQRCDARSTVALVRRQEDERQNADDEQSDVPRIPHYKLL
eukprot:CAMPEP_0185212184 /NCGR_PEP_ID=MMETSP1140-20130426/67399_1 /TAXON_ID=298111 /ORGANISM="Pavlova sp., Strain CCMP459" /LENGTH=173 /DNA_ID=CAMNT_0027780035 /DNA_START=285 /DNA_END=807 /DNA_ORIENTATION=-